MSRSWDIHLTEELFNIYFGRLREPQFEERVKALAQEISNLPEGPVDPKKQAQIYAERNDLESSSGCRVRIAPKTRSNKKMAKIAGLFKPSILSTC